jgi:membrane protease YdiL (CAAX protease family)
LLRHADAEESFTGKEDSMSTIRAFIKSHPVLTYYAFTFAISWGGFLVVIGGPSGIPGTPEEFATLFPLVVPVVLVGPSVSSILLTGLVDGRAGYRELFSRLLRWRVSARWYAVALLTAPLVFTAVSLPLALTSPVYLPALFASADKGSALISGIMAGLMVGFMEELGWTGFAIPRLRLRYGVLTTGLIVGVLWGAWHLLPQDLWIGDTYAGGISMAVFVTLSGIGFLAGQLPAYRVLMVWVYDRTGSLLLAMLMHASLTACTFILGVPSATGAAILTYDLVLSVAWWVVVAAVLWTEILPRQRKAGLPLKA